MRRDTLTLSLRRESLERRRFHKLYVIAFVPRAARIWLSTVSDSGRVVRPGRMCVVGERAGCKPEAIFCVVGGKNAPAPSW